MRLNLKKLRRIVETQLKELDPMLFEQDWEPGDLDVLGGVGENAGCYDSELGDYDMEGCNWGWEFNPNWTDVWTAIGPEGQDSSNCGEGNQSYYAGTTYSPFNPIPGEMGLQNHIQLVWDFMVTNGLQDIKFEEVLYSMAPSNPFTQYPNQSYCQYPEAYALAWFNDVVLYAPGIYATITGAEGGVGPNNNIGGDWLLWPEDTPGTYNIFGPPPGPDEWGNPQQGEVYEVTWAGSPAYCQCESINECIACLGNGWQDSMDPEGLGYNDGYQWQSLYYQLQQIYGWGSWTDPQIDNTMTWEVFKQAAGLDWGSGVVAFGCTGSQCGLMQQYMCTGCDQEGPGWGNTGETYDCVMGTGTGNFYGAITPSMGENAPNYWEGAQCFENFEGTGQYTNLTACQNSGCAVQGEENNISVECKITFSEWENGIEGSFWPLPLDPPIQGMDTIADKLTFCARCLDDSFASQIEALIPENYAYYIQYWPNNVFVPSCSCCSEEDSIPIVEPEPDLGPIIGCTDPDAINYNPDADFGCFIDLTAMGYGDSPEAEQYGNNCNEPWQGEGCGCIDENGEPYESQSTNCCCDYTSEPTENNWQSFGPACCDLNAENYGQNADGVFLNINGSIDTYIMTMNPWYNDSNCDWNVGEGLTGGILVINPNNYGPESFGVYPGSICVGDVSPDEEPEPVPMIEPPKDKEKEKTPDNKTQAISKPDDEDDESLDVDNRRELSESFKARLQKLAGLKKPKK